MQKGGVLLHGGPKKILFFLLQTLYWLLVFGKKVYLCR